MSNNVFLVSKHGKAHKSEVSLARTLIHHLLNDFFIQIKQDRQVQ